MEFDIVNLAKVCPGLVVSIRVEDLVKANEQLIAETKRELEQSISSKNAVTFHTPEVVEERLSISKSTLWRWRKNGYLVPVNVGGQYRYRSTDIDAILEGKK